MINGIMNNVQYSMINTNKQCSMTNELMTNELINLVLPFQSLPMVFAPFNHFEDDISKRSAIIC